ncbi:MAG: septum formation family protein [Acidimicrobiales bacterium]
MGTPVAKGRGSGAGAGRTKKAAATRVPGPRSRTGSPGGRGRSATAADSAPETAAADAAPETAAAAAAADAAAPETAAADAIGTPVPAPVDPSAGSDTDSVGAASGPDSGPVPPLPPPPTDSSSSARRAGPRRRRRGTKVLAVVIALVVVAAAVAILAGRSSRGVSYADLRPGDCIQKPKDTFLRANRVPCASEHDLEVFALIDDPAGRGAKFPGQDILEREANVACPPQFQSYVGVPFDRSSLTVVFYVPTSRNWDGGNRRLLCTVAARTGKLKGSVKGTSR